MATLEEELAKELCTIVREHVAAAVKPLRDEIARLQATGIRYAGTYQRAQTYKRGDITTHDGSMFCAVVDVGPNEQPGKCQAWQLCCMKGRDGKDARGA